ncbi:serpin family protein [Arthrobacter sp. TMN-37]
MDTTAGDPRNYSLDDGGQFGKGRRQAPVPPAEEAMCRAAYRVGAALLAAAPGSNPVTSPVSALYALLLLRTGAGSTTAAELDGVLGLPAEGRDAALGSLMAELARYDGDPGAVDEEDPPAPPVLHLANAVFVDRRTPAGKDFLAAVALHHGAGVHSVDYADPATKAVIDDWVAASTGGRIPEAPLKYDPDTTLSLLSTAYFAAAWAEPFDPSGTCPEEFRLLDGSVVAADRMYGRVRARYGAGPGWLAVDLPYTEGFVLRLVLDDGAAASGNRPDLPARTEEALLEVAAEMENAGEVFLGLGLPRWDSAARLDLVPLLRDLGLRETLGAAPDLHAIQRDAAVSAAAQGASITVGEKGTVAAAVTQIEVMVTSAPVDPELVLEVDRPFLYAVVHEGTGLPLFLGTVTDPR